MINRRFKAIPVTLNWEEQKSKLLARFPALTEDDLKYKSGKKYELITALCEKLGKPRKELIDLINSI